MGLFNHFPYTNFHEMNLDWLLTKVKSIDSEVTDIKNNIDISELYLVNILKDIHGDITCDRTISDIVEAFRAGRIPVCYLTDEVNTNSRFYSLITKVQFTKVGAYFKLTFFDTPRFFYSEDGYTNIYADVVTLQQTSDGDSITVINNGYTFENYTV